METIPGKLAFVRRVGENGVERRDLFSMRIHVLTDISHFFLCMASAVAIACILFVICKGE